MKKSRLSTKFKTSGGESPVQGAPPEKPASSVSSAPSATGGRKLKQIEREDLNRFYEQIQEKLDLGLSVAAQEQIEQIFNTYNLKIQDTATLHSFLSLALEMRGKYQDALEAVRTYEDDDLL